MRSLASVHRIILEPTDLQRILENVTPKIAITFGLTEKVESQIVACVIDIFRHDHDEKSF